MRRTWDPTIPALIAATVMLVGTVTATGGLSPGQWRAELRSDGRSVRLEIRLAEGRRETKMTTDVASSELQGFDLGTFSRKGAPLRLAWKHDAGSFVLEGVGGRHPGGAARFEPDPAFAERWRALGFEAGDAADLLRLATRGVRLADAERLHALGYTNIDANDLVRFASEPDAIAWVEEMHALGLRLALDDLDRLRAHGVDTAYAKGMFDAGVPADDLDAILRLHARGIPTAYVVRVRATGFSEVDVNDLIRLHDQGIDSDYVRTLVDAKLRRMTLDDIVRLHAHGVSADFAGSLVRAGREQLSVDDVIRANTRGPGASH